MIHWLAAGGVLFVLTLAWPLVAAADPQRGGEAGGEAEARSTPGGGGQMEAELTVPSGNAGGRAGGMGGTSPNGGQLTEGGTSGSVDEAQGMSTEYWTEGKGPCLVEEGSGEAGVLYSLMRHDARTGTRTLLQRECRDPAVTPDAPAPPPRTPTVGEISDLVRAEVAPPAVGVSPDPEGITGMPTRFWDEGPRQARVALALRGYAVTATLEPTAYCWDPGDPAAGRLCAPYPGSEDDWAADWVYETKGTYQITAETIWNGTWTFSGHGASAGGELATIHTTRTRAYPVAEVRSRLTSRP